MPSRITYLERIGFGIKDSSDPSHPILIALQVWNISDVCRNVRFRAVLIFSQMRSGLLVVLRDCNINDPLSGREVIYSLNKYNENSLAQQKVFLEFSALWGIKPNDLSKLIYDFSRTLVD
ncbi:MAG: hypothetical protein WC663_00160 [Patescibacteria group bacterium]|jgi:hypothetical protein